MNIYFAGKHPLWGVSSITKNPRSKIGRLTVLCFAQSLFHIYQEQEFIIGKHFHITNIPDKHETTERLPIYPGVKFLFPLQTEIGSLVSTCHCRL